MLRLMIIKVYIYPASPIRVGPIFINWFYITILHAGPKEDIERLMWELGGRVLKLSSWSLKVQRWGVNSHTKL